MTTSLPRQGLPAGLRRPAVFAAGGAAALASGVVLAVVIGWAGGPVYTTGWTTTVFGLLAVGAALLSGAAAATSAAAGHDSAQAARRAHGQQLYELARSVHADLTTGEVAAARDRLGALARNRQRLWHEGGPPQAVLWGNIQIALAGRGEDAAVRIGQARQDWFTLLWCFQRVHAAHTLLAQAPSEATDEDQNPLAFLEDLVRRQVQFLNASEAVHARAALEELLAAPVDDHDSALAFRELAKRLLEQPPARWARPLTTQVGAVLQRILLATPDFPLRELSDEQFLALHQALFAGESGAHMPDRTELARRMREQAADRRAAGAEDTAGTLWGRAEAIEAHLPETSERPEP